MTRVRYIKEESARVSLSRGKISVNNKIRTYFFEITIILKFFHYFTIPYGELDSSAIISSFYILSSWTIIFLITEAKFWTQVTFFS